MSASTSPSDSELFERIASGEDVRGARLALGIGRWNALVGLASAGEVEEAIEVMGEAEVRSLAFFAIHGHKQQQLCERAPDGGQIGTDAYAEWCSGC